MKLISKYFFFFITVFCLFLNIGMAQSKSWSAVECGRYTIDGVVRKNPHHGLILVVNEKSKSENKLTFKSGELSKVALYIDKSISMEAVILKIDGTRGEVSSIESVKLRLPDPLHPDLDGGFILRKKMECAHE